MKMPEFVKNFIAGLSDEKADELWEYLDGAREARSDMIDEIARTHKKLAKKHASFPGKKVAKTV